LVQPHVDLVGKALVIRGLGLLIPRFVMMGSITNLLMASA